MNLLIMQQNMSQWAIRTNNIFKSKNYLFQLAKIILQISVKSYRY